MVCFYNFYQWVCSVSWYCSCVDGAGVRLPHHRFNSYKVGLLVVLWLQAKLAMQTLVVPPTRYQCTAYPYGDRQVVELHVCLVVGRGFDSPTGCSVAPNPESDNPPQPMEDTPQKTAWQTHNGQHLRTQLATTTRNPAPKCMPTPMGHSSLGDNWS